MRRLYTFILYLLIPFILVRLLWKSWRFSAYRHRIAERFTLGKTALTKVDVWLHAVSMGEVIAAIPLIDALLAKQLRVIITTMTPSGLERIQARFGERVLSQYVPYDLPWALRRFFNRTNPRIGIIMETELWPNLIYAARYKKMPLLLANGRISDKAFKSYEKVRFFFKPILNQYTAILAQSALDANRFIALGAPAHLVSVLGNMKFDLQVHIPDQTNFKQFKLDWGKDRPVLIAASTHDNEEKQLLSSLTILKKAIPDLLLLIAPRHQERFQAVYQLSQQLGFDTVLRSQPVGLNANTAVMIVDSLGELLGFYHLSDYAFVGGSLVPIGGHNVLEPIAVQLPVFTGPFMNNSQSICDALCAAGAMQKVSNAEELMQAIIRIHENKAQRTQQIANANTVLNENKGSLARHLQKIEECLQ